MFKSYYHKIKYLLYSVIATILCMKMLKPSFKHQTDNFKPFFVHFCYFRDGLLKSLIPNIYRQNIRL
jgi:hypothetical protein